MRGPRGPRAAAERPASRRRSRRAGSGWRWAARCTQAGGAPWRRPETRRRIAARPTEPSSAAAQRVRSSMISGVRTSQLCQSACTPSRRRSASSCSTLTTWSAADTGRPARGPRAPCPDPRLTPRARWARLPRAVNRRSPLSSPIRVDPACRGLAGRQRQLTGGSYSRRRQPDGPRSEPRCSDNRRLWHRQPGGMTSRRASAPDGTPGHTVGAHHDPLLKGPPCSSSGRS